VGQKASDVQGMTETRSVEDTDELAASIYSVICRAKSGSLSSEYVVRRNEYGPRFRVSEARVMMYVHVPSPRTVLIIDHGRSLPLDAPSDHGW
jgi:methylase of polypeptide subunit release factors